LENCFLMPPMEGMWRLARFCPKNDILLLVQPPSAQNVFSCLKYDLRKSWE
jgi:hypothetical protein